MDELAATVNDSTELQDVECVHRLLPTGLVEVVRLDDMTVVEEHTATVEERQKGLFPDGKAGKGDDAEDDGEVKGPKGKGKAGK
jgi:hypothetical protein